MKKKRTLFGSIHPAIISVWAALIASAHLLPAIVLIGTGGTMSVSAILVPLAGVLFGPIAGMVCGGIGQFIGFLIAPSGAWLGMFTWLIGTCTATISGLISRGKWPIAAGVLGVAIVLWFSHPIGQKAWIFAAIFAGYGMLCIVLGGLVAKKWLLRKNIILKAIAIFVSCVGGMVTSGMLANFANLVLFSTPAISWKMLAFVSPVERTIFAGAAALIGVPLLIGLPKVGIFVGPEDPSLAIDESEDEED